MTVAVFGPRKGGGRGHKTRLTGRPAYPALQLRAADSRTPSAPARQDRHVRQNPSRERSGRTYPTPADGRYAGNHPL